MDNKQVSQLTSGALVVLIGLLLLAGQLDSAWHFHKLWPLIFVVLGVSKFLATTEGGERGSGLFFLFLGAIFLMHTYRILRLNDSWPLFVVAAGIGLMFGKKNGPPASRPEQGAP